MVVAAAVAFASVAGAGPAWAASEVEPNDDIAHPTGPLAPGTPYEGRFQTAGDRDWFVLYVNPGQPIDVAITKKDADLCSTTLDARLLDADGRKVDSKTVSTGYTSNIRQTAPPAPTRYYLLLVTDCAPGTAGDPYEIRAGPATAVVTASPAGASQPRPDPVSLGEPNESIVRAFGPLAGATQYGGTMGSATDEDWFVLYTRPRQAVDVALTKVGPGCSSTIDARMFDADGRGLRGTAVSSNETDHFKLTTRAVATRYYVQLFDDCAGDAYQLRVEPATAIRTRSRPPAPSALIREPNDLLRRAFGPLAGSTLYRGDFRSARDVDHIFLYASRGRSIDLEVTKDGRGCSPSIEARLVDFTGRVRVAGGPASNQIWHLRFVARRSTAYVLRLFSGCRGDPYRVRVDPAGRVSVRPPPALRVTPRRARRPPFGLTASGSLLGQLGLRRARLCRRAWVLLSVTAGRRKGRQRKIRVRPDCSYSWRTRVTRRSLRGRHRLRITARFRGPRALSRLRARHADVRVG